MINLLKYLIIILSINSIFAQKTYFLKTYNIKNGYNIATAVLTIDDGYVFVGQYIDTVKRQLILVKTDMNGDTLWSKAYGKPHEIYYSGYGSGLIATIDGGFAVCGTYMDTTDGHYDILLVKFDTVGDTLWTKKYGGIKWEFGHSCIQLEDKSFVLGGYTESYGNGQIDFYLIKTDSSGNQLWQKTYGGNGNENALYVEQTFDKGFILSGYTNSYGAGDYDSYIVKTDSNGNFQWQKTFGTIENDNGCGASQTTDSGYIISGAIDDGTGYSKLAFLAKLKSNGDTVWQKTYGWQYKESFNSTAVELKDGSFVVAGFRRNSNNDRLGWLMKVNAQGDSIWSRMHHTENPVQMQYFYDVERTWDNGFIMTGFAVDSIQNSWLVKVDSMGCLVLGCDTVGDTTSIIEYTLLRNDISVSPNPFSYSTTIKIQSGQLEPNTPIHIAVYDLFGREVKSISGLMDQITIYKDQLPPGMYFYKVMSEKEVTGTGKLVIE